MRRVTVAAAALVAVSTPASVLAHGVGQGPPPTDPLAIALAWHLDVPMILGAAGGRWPPTSAAVRSVERAHPGNRWPRRRTVAFLVALVAIGLALLSPIDTLSDDLLTVHMVQHLLLVAVAAPLFAASGIGTLALRAASAETRSRYLLPFLHSRVVSALTFPVVGWVAFAGVMWGSHFTRPVQRRPARRRRPRPRAPALRRRGLSVLVAAPQPRSAPVAAPSGREAPRAPRPDATDELPRDHDRDAPRRPCTPPISAGPTRSASTPSPISRSPAR